MDAPHVDELAADSNRAVVGKFLGRLALSDDQGNKDRTEHQRHAVAFGVPLSKVLDELLGEFSAPDPTDGAGLIVLRALCNEMLRKDGTRTAAIYQMSHGRPRERSVDQKGRIKALFQGANPVQPKSEQGRIYKGDKALATPAHGVVIQIHTLTLKNEKGEVLAANVPTLAVYVAKDLRPALLVQDQATRKKGKRK